MLSLKNRIDLFFIVAVFFTLFTKLRFFNLPIGVGEILIVFLFIIVIINILKNKKFNLYFNNVLTIFWMISFILLIIGYLSFSYLQSEVSTISAILHDVLAYIFIYFFILIIITLSNKLSFEIIMEKFTYLFLIFYTLLLTLAFCFNIDYFMYADFSRWEGFRFSGLSKNPNQLALSITIIPFLVYYFCKKEGSIIFNRESKLFLLLVFILVLVIRSDALYISIFCGFLIFAILKLSSKNKILLLYILVSVFLFFVILYKLEYMPILEKINLIQYKAGIRFELANNSLDIIKESYFIGLGPGPHSLKVVNGTPALYEAHNTYIDWMSQTGILGLVIFLFMLFKIIKGLFLSKEYLLFGALVSLLVFSYFHMVLRQPIFWFYLFFFYYTTKKNSILNIKRGENTCVE